MTPWKERASGQGAGGRSGKEPVPPHPFQQVPSRCPSWRTGPAPAEGDHRASAPPVRSGRSPRHGAKRGGRSWFAGDLLPRRPGPRSHQSGHQPAGGAEQAPPGQEGTPQCGQTPNPGARVCPGPPGLTTREKQAVGAPRPVTGGRGLAEIAGLPSFGREGGSFLGD